MRDITVSKALLWVFIAEILSIFSGQGVIGSIIGIVAFVLNLVALYGASKHEQGYHTAVILSIVGTVVSVVGAIVGESTVMASIVSIISAVVGLAILYFVVITTCNILEANGDSDVAQKGYTVWKLNLILTIVTVVLLVLSLISVVLAGILAIVMLIVGLVASILYLVFLWKSHKALA